MKQPLGVEAVKRLLQQGDIAGGERACREWLKQEPNNADGWELLAMIAQHQQRFGEVVACLARAAAVDAGSAIRHLRHGIALREISHSPAEAEIAFRRAVGLDPTMADAHHQLGNARKALGRLADAEKSLRQAAQLDPGNAVVWLNLGVTRLEQGFREEALQCFDKAIAAEPARAEAHNIRAATLLGLGRVHEAELSLREALRLDPQCAAARDNLGRAYRAQARIPEAIGHYREALRAKPDAATHSNLCYAMNLSSDCLPEEVFAEHRRWAEAFGGTQPRASGGEARNQRLSSCLTGSDKQAVSAARDVSQNEGVRPSAGRPLRIGFVSPDFCNHAVSYFFESLLTHRPTHLWRAFCYSDVKVPDAVTKRLRASSDGWRDTATFRDEALAEVVRHDQIDILFDLAGHTAGNRLRVFGMKPAPIQVTWLGYPNTTGLSTIDYRITDSLADPIGQTEAWHSETLWRLPGPFLCYRPAEAAPPVAACPSTSAGHVTFGSFSNLAKLSPPCVETWSRVLTAVPGAHLRLKSRGLADPALAADVRARFGRYGIGPERIELDGDLVGTSVHLGQYGGIDIALDPFPYNGTTTTCEALWMGVPVVTLAGATHVARVGVSLLTHVGHPEWIASSREEYARIAADLAIDVQGRQTIRTSARDVMAASRLCDAHGFAVDFGEALSEMAERVHR